MAWFEGLTNVGIYDKLNEQASKAKDAMQKGEKEKALELNRVFDKMVGELVNHISHKKSAYYGVNRSMFEILDHEMNDLKQMRVNLENELYQIHFA